MRFNTSSSVEDSTSDVHDDSLLEIESSESENSSDPEYTEDVPEENEGENIQQNEPAKHQAPRRSTRKFSKTKPFWVSLSAIALSAQVVPISYKQATTPDNIDFWKPGIDHEHDCLVRNNTWTLVDRKQGMHVLPNKYVFRVKNDLPKTRLVVLGCQQVFGLDYYHTFAPVVKFSTIRVLLAIVASLDWECEQMDVVTAFLNGDLEENIYMQIPEGLVTEEVSHKVCKLNKALYGLKQAPRQWYAKIHNYLVHELKFKSSVNDPCLYIKKTSIFIILIALYVDDLLLIGNSKEQISKLKREFRMKFEMKDLGPVELMLGIQIKRDRSNRKLFITQKNYIEHILRRFGMQDSKSVSTPMEKISSKLYQDTSNTVATNVPYRQVIGSLIYLVTGSRPDIAYSVGKLSKFLDKPQQVHWMAAKRVLRYLSGTRSHGIVYDGKRGLEVQGYSDSDYAGCIESRKSTSGYIFLLAGGAVSWKSKLQSTTATSTCEAEYMACCSATKEAIWLSRVISDIQNTHSPMPITIRVDNNGTIDLSNNPSINERSKHIDVHFHFVRECVHLNRIQLEHCNTEDMIADSLTKPLERVKYSKFTILQGINASI